jgi:hypothetical protein
MQSSHSQVTQKCSEKELIAQKEKLQASFLYIFPAHIQVDRYCKERRITKIASAKFPIMQHHSRRRRMSWEREREREKMQPTYSQPTESNYNNWMNTHSAQWVSERPRASARRAQ